MVRRLKSEIRLGPMETQIMTVVWQKGEATVRDVHEILAGGNRSPAYSTILTMMRKLEVKGYLSHKLNDRTFVYQATISKKEARGSIVGNLLTRLFEGSAVQLLTSLIEEKKVSQDEINQIRNLLNEKGRSHE
jgi:BlaI family transcriptional regulator, penicillinase repressor